MRVSLRMEKAPNKTGLLSFTRGRSVLGLIFMSAFCASQLIQADVPVVESRAVNGSYGSEVAKSNSVVADGASNGFMLQTIEQLRTEMMELRGLVEEQTHLLQRIQNEHRERYVDLDERVSRLSTQPQPLTGSPVLKPPVDSTSETAALTEQEQASLNEEEAYEKAFSMIREKRFDEARRMLSQQLEDFPRGRYSDNAQYWLGEVYMAQGQYPEAQKAFNTLLSNHADSIKIPDATYKLGRLADILGDKKQARSYLQSVIKKIP